MPDLATAVTAAIRSAPRKNTTDLLGSILRVNVDARHAIRDPVGQSFREPARLRRRLGRHVAQLPRDLCVGVS